MSSDNLPLSEMIQTLRSMSNRRKRPADGLGLYLGDGLPHSGAELRSNQLLQALLELQVLRRQDKQEVDTQ